MKMLLTLLMATVLLSSCNMPESGDSQFTDTNGVGYRLENYDGQYLVINYWATWCAPCKKEIPELIALGDNHADVEVLGVNYDMPGPQEMQEQIEEMKITFPVLSADPHQLLGVEKPAVLPTTIIRGPAGGLTTLIGPQTEASLLEAMGKAMATASE